MAEISGNEDLRGKPDENVIRLRFKPDTYPQQREETKDRDEKKCRASSSALIVLAVGYAVLLIVAVGAFVIYGVPGTTGVRHRASNRLQVRPSRPTKSETSTPARARPATARSSVK
jgi:hypothetical protein